MSTMATDDQVEESDINLDADSGEVIIAEEPEETPGSAQATPELDPEIEQEIKRVIIEEEPVKAKAQMLPENLINKKLEPDDLFDAGSI